MGAEYAAEILVYFSKGYHHSFLLNIKASGDFIYKLIIGFYSTECCI